MNAEKDATCADCGHWWEQHYPVCMVGGIPCGCLSVPDGAYRPIPPGGDS